MPVERPLGFTDVVQVTIVRASAQHEHECPGCGKVYWDVLSDCSTCAEYERSRDCADCFQRGGCDGGS